MQKFALLLILALSAIQCGAVSESALRKSSQERQLWGSSSSSSSSTWSWWDYLTMHLCHMTHPGDHEDHCPSPPKPHHSSGGGSHSSGGGGGGGGSDDSTYDCGTCYGDDCDECEEGDDECTCECKCSWGDDGHAAQWGDDGHVEEWGDDGHEDDDTWEDDGHDDDGEDDGIWANDGHDDDEYWGSDGYSEQYVNAASSGNYSAENGSNKKKWGFGIAAALLVGGLAFLVTRKRKRNQNNDVPQDVYVDADNMNNRGDGFRNDPQSVEMQTMNTGKISRAQSFKTALSMKSMQLRNKFRRSPANVPDGDENLYGGNGAYDAPAAFDHESINSNEHGQGGVVM